MRRTIVMITLQETCPLVQGIFENVLMVCESRLCDRVPRLRSCHFCEGLVGPGSRLPSSASAPPPAKTKASSAVGASRNVHHRDCSTNRSATRLTSTRTLSCPLQPARRQFIPWHTANSLSYRTMRLTRPTATARLVTLLRTRSILRYIYFISQRVFLLTCASVPAIPRLRSSSCMRASGI